MASWCDTCTLEMQSFRQALEKLPDGRRPEVIIIGVLDTAENLATYRDAAHLPFPLIADADGTYQSKFALTSIPATALLGEDGSPVSFVDPFTGQNVSLLAGPRDWSDPRAKAFLAHTCNARQRD